MPHDAAISVACSKLAYEHRVATWCAQFLADLKFDSEATLVRQLRDRSILSIVRDRLGAIDDAVLLDLLEAQPLPQSGSGTPIVTQVGASLHDGPLGAVADMG